MKCERRIISTGLELPVIFKVFFTFSEECFVVCHIIRSLSHHKKEQYWTVLTHSLLEPALHAILTSLAMVWYLASLSEITLNENPSQDISFQIP